MITGANAGRQSDPLWKVVLLFCALFGLGFVLYRTIDTQWPLGSVVMVICAIPTYFVIRKDIRWSFRQWLRLWVMGAALTALLEWYWGGPYPR